MLTYYIVWIGDLGAEPLRWPQSGAAYQRSRCNYLDPIPVASSIWLSIWISYCIRVMDACSLTTDAGAVSSSGVAGGCGGSSSCGVNSWHLHGLYIQRLVATSSLSVALAGRQASQAVVHTHREWVNAMAVIATIRVQSKCSTPPANQSTYS